MLHPDSYWLDAFGRHWTDVARASARSGRQAEAVSYFRLMYLGGECAMEDAANKAAYPQCAHGRKTVLLRGGEPVCSCEVLE